MQPKVSIIIPAYKTALYLRRCLDSVCGQTLRDIEIICVDDASPDDTLDIMREYAARDSRVRIIGFASNLGTAAARNAAMAVARGEFLGFVDSDDAIDSQFYEKLHARARETGALIVKGELIEIKESGLEVRYVLNDKVRLSKLNFTWQWYTAIYNTALIRNNGINCPLGVINGQDTAFLLKAISVAPSVETVDDALYRYFRWSDSVSSKIGEYKRIVAVLNAHEDVVSFLNSHLVDTASYDALFWLCFKQCLYRFLKAPLAEQADAATACAKSVIRLYTTCIRSDALNNQLASFLPAAYSFIQSANVTRLVEYLLLHKIQHKPCANNIMNRLRNNIRVTSSLNKGK